MTDNDDLFGGSGAASAKRAVPASARNAAAKWAKKRLFIDSSFVAAKPRYPCWKGGIGPGFRASPLVCNRLQPINAPGAMAVVLSPGQD